MADTSWQVLEGALTLIFKDAKGATSEIKAARAQISQGGTVLLTLKEGKQMAVSPGQWIDLRT